jgi:hypothetical protein
VCAEDKEALFKHRTKHSERYGPSCVTCNPVPKRSSILSLSLLTFRWETSSLVSDSKKNKALEEKEKFRLHEIFGGLTNATEAGFQD